MGGDQRDHRDGRDGRELAALRESWGREFFILWEGRSEAAGERTPVNESLKLYTQDLALRDQRSGGKVVEECCC